MQVYVLFYMCAHFPTGSYSSTLYFCGYIVFKFNLYVMVHSVCLAVPDACHWQNGHVVHNCRIPFYELWLNGIPAHVLVHTVSLSHSSTDTGVVSLSLPLLLMLLWALASKILPSLRGLCSFIPSTVIQNWFCGTY